MKLYEIQSLTPERVIQLIRRDCKHFLNESDGHHLYRATLNKPPIFYDKPRTDRTPKDTNEYFHDMFNELIANKNLDANRSNSFFCTANYKSVYFMAHANDEAVYFVFPVGDFNFTWNTKLEDWYEDVAAKQNEDWDWRDQKKFLENLRGNDNSLLDALQTSNEIMISAPCYFINREHRHLLKEIYN